MSFFKYNELHMIQNTACHRIRVSRCILYSVEITDKLYCLCVTDSDRLST